ncbi:MAG: ribosome biogenesis GTP-binding protein YihA/YsxC [Eubacteriales bacterium]|nr:ribosome biogenesis GTP-binding protein YihA/YsxC [Eubacteriales bacterium]
MFKDAKFVISLPCYGDFPGRGLPQLAVCGRSNVGKSSLINSLCRRRGLAKTSSTPGKTRLINVFLIDNTFHLIDLPGYGYAKVSRREQQNWGLMMSDYFSQADELALALHLVDIRHEPSQQDLEMNAYLYQAGLPFRLVATKSDKVSRSQRQKHLADIARLLAVQPWEIIPFSSQTGEGRDALAQSVYKLILPSRS